MSGGRIVGMLWLLAPLLSGCGSSAVPKNTPDPLNGMSTLQIPKEPTPTPTVKGPTQPLPPLPAPSSATSPASLASNAVPKLEDDRPLRIPSDKDAGWGGQSSPGVTLGRPGTDAGTAGERTLTPVPAIGPLVPVSGTSPPADSIDQMLQTLRLRGVKGFQLLMQRETGEWSCTCSIPRRDDPASKTTYNKVAGDPQSALKAVVEQVERDAH